MPGEWMKRYWEYRKAGGTLSMKDFAAQQKGAKPDDVNQGNAVGV